MKTDRELIELAAKAAGYYITDYDYDDYENVYGLLHGDRWNPLWDDGDALRLAIKLKLDVCFYDGFQEVGVQGDFNPEPVEANEKYGNDINSATRRAIVRAAAYMGQDFAQ